MIDAEAFKNEFQHRYSAEPIVISAPGRVNLIGEHTDYNDGFVMPFAIDRQTLVGISARPDDHINVHTLTLDKTAEFELDSLSATTGRKNWTKYIAGMAAVLKRSGSQISGANMLIDSDIPFGAGLSSSAALEIATGFAFLELIGQQIDPRELAKAGQKVEHEFVGVRSGIMDQLASAMSHEDHALLLDCRSLDIDFVPLELGTAMLAAVDTNVKHSLASSKYNERRSECERGVELLSKQIPGISALRDVSSEQLREYENLLPEPIKRRCRHVITENERTLEAAKALRRRDLDEVGRLMDLSHASLRDDYEVSCAELDLLAGTADEIDGVYGSRMTGGGFGGCTISLLENSAFENFEEQTTARYKKAFGREPTIFAVKPSAGARRID
jgi:galactokinase